MVNSGGVPMLVLSRMLNESITIGPDIKVTVVDIQRGKVKIGIEAPDEVRIERKEAVPLDACRHNWAVSFENDNVRRCTSCNRKQLLIASDWRNVHAGGK